MTGSELQQRRAALGLRVEQLAEFLDEHPDAIRQWERITGNLPRALVRRITWILATEERAMLMKAGGIDECSWIEEHLESLEKLSSDELEQRLRQAEQHAKDCQICQRREAFAAHLPPLPPMPLPVSGRILAWLAGQLQRLPQWLRPAAIGALLIGGLTVVRALFLVAFQRARPSTELFLTIIAAIGVGAYGGAVGGLTYGAVRERVRKFGRIGDYLTGLACVYAYLLAFGIPLALFTDEEMFRGAVGWISMTVVGTLFGLIVGHSWLRDQQSSDKPDAEHAAEADATRL